MISYSDYIAEKIGNSRIDGSTIYKVNGNGTSGNPSLIVSGLTETIQEKNIQNNQELNRNWNQNQKFSNNDFGQWTKNEKKSIKPYEKWTIGIGICSLIIGIVTIVVMLVA
jgi:hypothetical protein